MLSDKTIVSMLNMGGIFLDPMPDFKSPLIQPASIDLRLGNSFIKIARERNLTFNVGSECLYMNEGEFILAETLETVGINNNVVARVEGKSTWGRHGLMVHSTAGFIDPGFRGKITLELKNLSPRTIRLMPGMTICQISFDRLDQECERPYGHRELNSHYQGQRGTTLPWNG